MKSSHAWKTLSGGGGIMVWGGISLNGKTELVILDDSLTGRRYVESSSVKDGGRLSRILVIEQNDLGELRNFV